MSWRKTYVIQRWSFFTFIYNRSSNMKYFIYTSHHFTPHRRYELTKLTSFPVCRFIAQLVEHRTGIAEVTGSNPVEALIFQASSFQLLKLEIDCDDHSSLSDSKSSARYWDIWKNEKASWQLKKNLQNLKQKFSEIWHFETEEPFRIQEYIFMTMTCFLFQEHDLFCRYEHLFQ